MICVCVCVCLRAGVRRGRSRANLCCDSGGKLSVDDEAKCRGGEHGEFYVTLSMTENRLKLSEKLMGNNLISLQMTSVERVVEYTELKNEAPWETQTRPPPDWPSRGLVTLNKVNFSYSDDGPLVLKDIDATFHPNEKVRHLAYIVFTYNVVFTTHTTSDSLFSHVSDWNCG